jgi:hypothetical protein
MLPMNRLLRLADGINRLEATGAVEPIEDVLHVYRDGVLLVLHGSADRHLSVRDGLKDIGEVEEAKAGAVSVFVVRLDVGDKLPPSLIAATKRYANHRHERPSTLDGGFALLLAGSG